MKLLGYVSDEEAKTLMRDCKAFLFPSIYEGFGIPPLEAMSAGCKRIIVSDTEVMHEIFGDSVEYINSTSRDYNIDIDLKVLEKDKKNVLKSYSWEMSAKYLYSLIERWGKSCE